MFKQTLNILEHFTNSIQVIFEACMRFLQATVKLG